MRAGAGVMITVDGKRYTPVTAREEWPGMSRRYFESLHGLPDRTFAELLAGSLEWDERARKATSKNMRRRKKPEGNHD